jgi:twitching motility protein PilT
VAAVEVMVMNPAIQNLINEEKTYQIFYVIQASLDEGMQTMDAQLNMLVKQGLVAQEDAGVFTPDHVPQKPEE